jgi:thiosulfate/3-mercaptopyruvate sulfurtransferase
MHSLKKLITFTILLIAGLPALASAGLGDYFVQTDWLAENRSKVVVLDARQTPLFILGHIEGAHHLPRSGFLDKRDGVKSLVPTTTAFESLMGEFGITPETTVVTYAEDGNPYAARLAWTLRYHGHDKVLVLDGGYENPPSLSGTPAHLKNMTAQRYALIVAAISPARLILTGQSCNTKLMALKF